MDQEHSEQDRESIQDYAGLIARSWSPDDVRFRLSEHQITMLGQFLALLNHWNRVHSLTAIEEPQSQVVRHILDALVVWPRIAARLSSASVRVADVGSGMGVPGVVLAIVLPQCRFDLIERQQKKASFLRHVIARLDLTDRVRVLDQDVAKVRVDEGYDLIVCRAFSALTDFLAITYGLSKPSTLWAAMTGKKNSGESTRLTMKNNSGDFVVDAIDPLLVAGLNAQRHLIWVRRSA